MDVVRMRGAWSLVFVLVLSSIGCLGASAQDETDPEVETAGAITGTVVEAGTGDPLPGANVTVEGTGNGTSTDLNGRYQLRNLESGTYDVLFSFVGFQRKTVTNVEVSAGATTTLDVQLAEETEQLDEVVVSAEAARDSEAGLLKKRAKAAAVSDAISAETISRSGAGTAADAMSKVTGASVTEGKYVNVRGLQGRYVDTQLDGSKLPSTDPDGNSVALDLFPSNLIDNIVTTKTFTPDRPADFTGGSVDITTKSLPSSFFANVSVSTSFNSEVGIGGNILRPVSGLDAVPAVASDENVPETLGQTLNDPDQRAALDALSRAFATGVSPGPDDTAGNRSAEISAGDRFTIADGRSVGILASFSYDESFSGFNDGTTTRFKQTGAEAEGLSPTADYTTRRGVEKTLMGGLIGLSVQPAPQHEVQLRGIYNEDNEKEARIERGRLPRDLSSGQLFETRVSRTTDRAVRSGEVKGTHRFGGGADGIRVEWRSSLSKITRDEPDYRFFSNQFQFRSQETDGFQSPPEDWERSMGDDNVDYSISPSIYPRPTRFFRDLEEDSWSNSLSAEMDVGTIKLKAGGNYQVRSREFRERRFEHFSDQNSINDAGGNPDMYVNDLAGLRDGADRFGTYVLDRSQPRNNYDADLDRAAGFLMAELPVPGVPALKFVGGARLEYSDLFMTTQHDEPSDRLQGSFETMDVLPSANLIWSLRNNMNLRVAYGRTLALPSFREVSPAETFNFVGDYIERGSPDLNRTLVDNVDLRWEWFLRGGEVLSASVFYKDFQDPIERTIDAGSDAANEKTTFTNRESALVYGAELEARKRLGTVAEWLQHVQVGGNLTLTHSEVTRTEEVLEAIRAYRDNPSETRPLQGQSPYIVNLNVGYENPGVGTSVNVLFNRFGDRLQTVARNGIDIFEQGRSSLDVMASQRLTRGVEAKISVKNALNADEVVSQTFRGSEFVNDRRPLGRTVSVGLSYSY